MIKKIILLMATLFIFQSSFAESCLPGQEFNPEDKECYCPDWSIDKHRFWCVDRLNNSSAKDLKESALKITDFLKFLIIPISIIVLIYWWIMYSTALWDDAKMAKAKRTIFIAITWLILYLFYYIFIDFISTIFI